MGPSLNTDLYENKYTFLFEDFKNQDFSDTCMWVQDRSKWGSGVSIFSIFQKFYMLYGHFDITP